MNTVKNQPNKPKLKETRKMEEQIQKNKKAGQRRDENPKMTRRAMKRSRRLKVRELEATLYDDEFLASQALYRKGGRANAKCSLCGKCKIVKSHTASSRHVTALARFRTIFNVMGTLAVCAQCNSRVDWSEVQGHLTVHRVMPSGTPSCEDSASSTEDLAPSLDDCAPSCEDSAPSTEYMAPSCEDFTPSLDDCAPFCENTTASCGNEKPPGNSAKLFKSVTPSCENPAPFCENKPRSENKGQSRARSNTKATMQQRDEISLDLLNDLDANSFDALTFLIGPHTTKLEKSLKETFVPERSQKFAFYCVICADPIRDVKSARDHVSGRLHAVSSKKYECKSIVSTKYGYYCNCCDQKMDLLSVVYRHVLKNEHRRCHQSFEVFMEMALQEEIVEPNGEAAPSCEKSNTASKIPGLGSITGNSKKAVSTLPSSRDGRCSVNLTETLKSSDNHDAKYLKELDFVIGSHLPKLSDAWQQKLANVQSRGFFLHCIICESDIGNLKSAQDHVSGRRHAKSMKKFKCGDITSIENGYHCKCCNENIDRLSLVYRHVLTNEHTRHVQIRIAESNGEEVPSREHSRRTSENSTPSCERPNTASKTPCPDGISHDFIIGESKKGVSTLSSSSSSSSLSRDVGRSLSLTETSQSVDDPNVRFLKDFTFVIGPHIPRLCKIWNQILNIESRRGFVLYCVICDEPISDIESAREHVSGKRHANSMVKYRCDEITSIEDGYYCKCCDHKMQRLPVAYRHAIMKKHAHHLEERIAEFDGPEAPANASKDAGVCLMAKDAFEAPSREHSRDTSDSTTPSCEGSNKGFSRCSVNVMKISKNSVDSDVRFLEDLTFLVSRHTPKLGKKLKKKVNVALKAGCAFYCLICAHPIRDISNAREHVSGQLHADSMKKYGCENIVSTEKGYYCNCCNHEMKRLSLVFRHVITDKHAHYHQERIAESVEKEASVNASKIAEEYPSAKNDVEMPSCSAKSMPCRKNAVSSSENVTPFNESAVPLCKALSSAHVSCESSSRTSENSTPSLKDSAGTPLGGSYDHIVQLGKNKYTCRICGRKGAPIGNVHEHIQGHRHRKSLKKLYCASIATQENGKHENGEPHESKRASPWNLEIGSLENGYLQNRKFEDASTLSKVKREAGKLERAPRSENEAAPRNSLYDYIALKMGRSTPETLNDETYENDTSDKITKDSKNLLKKKPWNYAINKVKITCHICGKVVSDRARLHCHLASHFSDYFVSATATNTNTREIELSNFELDDDSVPDDDRTIDSSSPLPELLTANQPMETKKSKRNVDTRGTLAKLNFDKDVIYEMTDKMAEYELCSKLCVILDSSNIYCLVCRQPVPNKLQNFYDHLSSLDHCAYLEMMENDAARFARYADQFSDFDLAQEYMEERSDESVQCYACGVSVANETEALRAHIYQTCHSEAWKVLRAGAVRIADFLKPRASCDWYKIQQYWCVPCHKRFVDEVKFVAHLESAGHLMNTNETALKGKTMLLDYCSTCALLWYGYRVTRFYHERTSAHVVMRRDGYNATRFLSKFAMSLLAEPEVYADERIRRLDETEASERSKQRLLLEELEEIVRAKFPKAKAHTFGSRIAGLSSENSDIDVFLDCRNTYGGGKSESMTEYFIKGVYECLCKYPNSWDVDELLTSCRAPIIRVHHRETDLKCDLSFQNGLGVENTKLIRTYCAVYPPCRKLILIVKQWLGYCSLAESRVIKNYCLSWLVIFYLQTISILPSVATLVKMGNTSRKIAGWEVGVTHDFMCYEAHLGVDGSSPIVKLLKGFFGFYADFDFRREVVCPLLGYPVAKRDFIESKDLPDAMKPYKQYVSTNSKPEIFAVDSPMCVQDPFRMNDNLAKFLNKGHLNAFRVYCTESLNFILST